MDHTSLVPHAVCFLWKPDLIAMHVGSDLVIATAYFAIPAMLFTLLAVATKHVRLIGWFIAFILCCGVTHILDAITIWSPIYYLQGWIKILTACVSIGAAVHLYRLFMRIQDAMDTPAQADAVYQALAALRGTPHGRL